MFTKRKKNMKWKLQEILCWKPFILFKLAAPFRVLN